MINDRNVYACEYRFETREKINGICVCLLEETNLYPPQDSCEHESGYVGFVLIE